MIDRTTAPTVSRIADGGRTICTATTVDHERAAGTIVSHDQRRWSD